MANAKQTMRNRDLVVLNIGILSFLSFNNYNFSHTLSIENPLTQSPIGPSTRLFPVKPTCLF